MGLGLSNMGQETPEERLRRISEAAQPPQFAPMPQMQFSDPYQYAQSVMQQTARMPMAMPMPMPSQDMIVDPSLMRQLEILSRPYTQPVQPQMMGSGLLQNLDTNTLMIPDWRAMAESFRPKPPPAPAIADLGPVAGGGVEYGNYDGGYDYTYDPQRDAQSGGSRAPSWVGLPADMRYDANQAGGYNPSSGQSYAESVGMGGDYGYSGYSSGEDRGE
jgi:hypothetical protein